MDLSCGKCDNSCRDKEVRCGGFCGKYFHMKCIGMSKYDCDAIFKHSNIKYICDGCLNFIKLTIENYKNLFDLVKENGTKLCEEINKTNILMEQRVEEARKEIVTELKKNHQMSAGTETYASKLKATNSVPVILKPKAKQNSDTTEKVVKEKIKPSALNLQVKGIIKRNDGAVTIRCENESDRNVLTEEIKEKMGNEYEVQAPRMRNPKILIVGMNKELDKNLIVQAIKKQNDIECGHMECVKVYKSYKNPKSYNAIIETDGEGFNQIMKKKKINIEWDRCPVYESCGVLRCFKCWGFNHTSNHCQNEHQICAKCSEIGHSYKDCKNNYNKCINCVKAKERLRLSDIDTNHDCRDTNCRVLQRRNKLEAERVAY